MKTKASLENISKEDLLIYGVKLLKDRNINYWLDCGTLLGIIRDRKLLPWDKDLDISVQKKNLSKLDISYIVAKVRNDGYRVNVYESCISITKKDYVFDIKLFDKREDFLIEKKIKPKNFLSSIIGVLIHCLTSEYGSERKGRNPYNQIVIRFVQKFSRALPKIIISVIVRPLNYVYEKYLTIDISEAVPSHFLQDFETLDFNGEKYIVPVKSKDYLAFRYGQNWKIPDENWVTDEDDGAYLFNKEINMENSKK